MTNYKSNFFICVRVLGDAEEREESSGTTRAKPMVKENDTIILASITGYRAMKTNTMTWKTQG